MMMDQSSLRKTGILDEAERLARLGGYDNFSFRDLAKAVGVKSASVHYHFPTKEALAEALVQRYSDRFLAKLDADLAAADIQPGDETKVKAIYRQAYKSALVNDGLMCLCVVFSAQIAVLPQTVAAQARRFLERNVHWLTQALEKTHAPQPQTAALKLVAKSEGAMLLARSLTDVQVDEQVGPTAIHERDKMAEIAARFDQIMDD